MKSLETVQKTFQVFQVLAKAAMILCFVGCGLCLLGAACGFVWRGGGAVIGADMETLLALTDSAALDRMTAALLADAVFVLTDALLFLFAWRYLRAEQADGTPFTFAGAKRVKNLGIKAIVMPLVAAMIAAVIFGCFGQAPAGVDWDGAWSVALGIVLIVTSLVFRYGAELAGREAEHP